MNTYDNAYNGSLNPNSPKVDVTEDYGFMPSRNLSNDGSLPSPRQWDSQAVVDARPILPNASFFMGDIRDGLPMINMQSLYLMSAKNFSEKQIGTLFFVFGLSQCIFMSPAGYFFDYSNHKIKWVIWSSVTVSVLTVFIAAFAQPEGQNMELMIVLKFLQGAATSFLPPGFNGITLGIVGSTGFTHQISRNKMMNHVGTALTVSVATLIAYFLYPNIGLLFFVSPCACSGFVYYLLKIKPTDVDRDAARGLIIKSPTMTEYETMDEQNDVAEVMALAEIEEQGGVLIHDPSDCESDISNAVLDYVPPQVDAEAGCILDDPNEIDDTIPEVDRNGNRTTSFSDPFGLGYAYGKGKSGWESFKQRRVETPLAFLMDRNLVIFTVICFFFHLANSSVLPLVMQSLSYDDPQRGLLMSGLCIMIAQSFMTPFAKISGDYSPIWGRKNLFLLGLLALPVRCGILVILLTIKDTIESETQMNIVHGFILATQFFDAVGAGIFATLYILITNDISGGTGRFSLMLGITSGAISLGATISGYLGQYLAGDYGYRVAMGSLGMISLLPPFLYFFFMPETLPDYAKARPKKRRKKLISLFLEINRRRKAVFAKKSKKSKMQEGRTTPESGTVPTQSIQTPIDHMVTPDGTATYVQMS